MKSRITIYFIINLLVSLGVVKAKPVLVAVELNNKDLIKSWSRQDYQTYDFINNTAIAEVDIGQIPILETQGFQCSIIDDLPWSEKYFITKTPGVLKINLPGRIIWQKDQFYLIKIPKNELSDLFALHLEFQPLKKSVLPNRFWDQMIINIIPISPNWDPFIQDIVDDVSTDSIMAYVQRLQDFRTRLALSDSSYAASEWLRQKYSSWGYPTEFDSFYIDTAMASWGYWPDTGYERNVIATYNGSVNPSKIFIVCGHFDAVVWHDTALAGSRRLALMIMPQVPWRQWRRLEYSGIMRGTQRLNLLAGQ